jgi:hypothetical protein
MSMVKDSMIVAAEAEIGATAKTPAAKARQANARIFILPRLTIKTR